MALNNPYDKYKNNSVFTATKEELTLMLYDGALKFANQALIALDNNDMTKVHDLLIKVQNIILEFQLTLDKKYDISLQLELLYDYIYRLLVEANLEKNKAKIEEARDMIRDLRDTWKEAMKLAKQQTTVAK